MRLLLGSIMLLECSVVGTKHRDLTSFSRRSKFRALNLNTKLKDHRSNGKVQSRRNDHDDDEFWELNDSQTYSYSESPASSIGRMEQVWGNDNKTGYRCCETGHPSEDNAREKPRVEPADI